MRQLIVLLLAFASLSGCKRAIEKIQEDMVISAMTDGQWKITSFISNGNNLTADFVEYKFQFFKDKTVNAIRNNVIEKKGSWEGHVETTSITAAFTNGGQPLERINGHWHIDKNSWTSVEASLIGTAGTTMHLEKL